MIGWICVWFLDKSYVDFTMLTWIFKFSTPKKKILILVYFRFQGIYLTPNSLRERSFQSQQVFRSIFWQKMIRKWPIFVSFPYRKSGFKSSNFNQIYLRAPWTDFKFPKTVNMLIFFSTTYFGGSKRSENFQKARWHAYFWHLNSPKYWCHLDVKKMHRLRGAERSFFKDRIHFLTHRFFT